jgi:hypothetical protein
MSAVTDNVHLGRADDSRNTITARAERLMRGLPPFRALTPKDDLWRLVSAFHKDMSEEAQETRHYRGYM